MILRKRAICTSDLTLPPLQSAVWTQHQCPALIHRYNTQVTDASLEHFKGLTNLQELALHGTQVTDAGVTELKKALPNCQISR